MRKNLKWMVAGSTVLGAAAMMTVGAGAVTGHRSIAPLHVRAADNTGNSASADQAAVSFVDATYPGAGVASVLSTTASTSGGLATYDVTITAPNGTTYDVQVQQSSDAVLLANPITPTTTTPPVTTPPVTTPPVTTPPVLTPVGNTPIVSGGEDGTEVEQEGSADNQGSTGTSSDNQGANFNSQDGQGDTTSAPGVITTPPSSSGSSDGQGVTSSQGGSSDSTNAPTTSGDN
ncbi:MAG TPA: hypothetical protein PLG60_01160 [Acidimicrobiales bacterium]|nr:hypothetical protein [Acidimicrobiales bacterium]